MKYGWPSCPVIGIVLLVAIFPGNIFKAQGQTAHPNIVFIYTDDQAYYTIHALGNKEIETPPFRPAGKNGQEFY